MAMRGRKGGQWHVSRLNVIPAQDAKQGFRWERRSNGTRNWRGWEERQVGRKTREGEWEGLHGFALQYNDAHCNGTKGWIQKYNCYCRWMREYMIMCICNMYLHSKDVFVVFLPFIMIGQFKADRKQSGRERVDGIGKGPHFRDSLIKYSLKEQHLFEIKYFKCTL